MADSVWILNNSDWAVVFDGNMPLSQVKRLYRYPDSDGNEEDLVWHEDCDGSYYGSVEGEEEPSVFIYHHDIVKVSDNDG